MSDIQLPEESRGEIIPIQQLAAEPVRMGIALWRDLSPPRRYPQRAALTSERLGALLDNCVVIEVIAAGTDYECGTMGAMLARGFGEDFAGRRLSAIIAEAPKIGLGLRMLFEMVRASGEPLGYRGWVGRDMKTAEFVYHESALLPFGPDETQVDHLLIMSAIVMRHDTGA